MMHFDRCIWTGAEEAVIGKKNSASLARDVRRMGNGE